MGGRVKWMNVVTAPRGARQTPTIAKHVRAIGPALMDLAQHPHPRLPQSLLAAVALGRKLVRQTSVVRARRGASPAPTIVKNVRDWVYPKADFDCSQCSSHGYGADQCGCGYCGSYGGCGWTCGHDSSQSPPGPKCSVGTFEV